MKTEWKDFFDDPSRTFTDPEDQEMAQIFHHISQWETPDPGQDYWNHFNARLQQKLATRKKIPFWRSSLTWISPMRVLAPALGLFALAIISVFTFNANQQKKINGFDALTRLSQQDLQFLGEYLLPEDETTLADSQNFWNDEILDELYEDPEDIYGDLDRTDPESLEKLFMKEG
jgi:hypothetical protein